MISAGDDVRARTIDISICVDSHS